MRDKRLDSQNQNIRRQFGSNDGRNAAPIKKKVEVPVQSREDEVNLDESYTLSDFYTIMDGE